LKNGQGFKGLALVSALWCRYCYGETESGQTIPPNDPSWTRLQAAARLAKDAPQKFLEMRDIFGELSDDRAYIDAFSDALSRLWVRGVRATLEDYVGAAP
jgi:mannitol 2-dehydrogenase